MKKDILVKKIKKKSIHTFVYRRPWAIMFMYQEGSRGSQCFHEVDSFWTFFRALRPDFISVF